MATPECSAGVVACASRLPTRPVHRYAADARDADTLVVHAPEWCVRSRFRGSRVTRLERERWRARRARLAREPGSDCWRGAVAAREAVAFDDLPSIRLRNARRSVRRSSARVLDYTSRESTLMVDAALLGTRGNDPRPALMRSRGGTRRGFPALARDLRRSAPVGWKCGVVAGAIGVGAVARLLTPPRSEHMARRASTASAWRRTLTRSALRSASRPPSVVRAPSRSVRAAPTPDTRSRRS